MVIGNGSFGQYRYDANSLRTEKISESGESKYYYVGDQLTYEKRGDKIELYYFYDSFGDISGIRYIKSGVSQDYIFLTNWRGDVETIYDGTGTLQARYTYDAWGNVTFITDENGNAITDETHIANVNPIRYRGYYQDAETGFYYLQSRYYDPVTHRFINADGFTSTGQGFVGENMFAYCLNSSTMLVDPNGTCPHDSKFYTSGPFKGQFKYNPSCSKCKAHGEFWLTDSKGNQVNMMASKPHKYKQMAICTDGGDKTHGSKTHQKQTAYQVKRQSVDPVEIRYVVAPIGYHEIANGDLALVIDHDTGKSVFAIVGDRGKTGKYNEVSLSVAWDLGYRWASGKNAPSGNFETIYFPNTAGSWSTVDELAAYLKGH